MLVLMSAYAGVTRASVPVNVIALGFGLFIALSMAALTVTRPRKISHSS
jgi:hypothetical protein